MSTFEQETPERIYTAMVTPFGEAGELNLAGVEELANHLVENGSDGLVLAGTTGESAELGYVEQHLQLFDVVRNAVGDDVTLIGGTGANTRQEAVELSKGATQRGSVDGLLVVSQYYTRPSQEAIFQYYEAVSEVTDLPITLYNIPVRTGRLVEEETIHRLMQDGHIDAVKDATGNTDMAAKLSAEYGDDLYIYSGDDGLNLEYIRAGAIGAISVASHWAGNEMQAMFEAAMAGDFERAEAIQAALEPSAAFESTHEDADGVYRDTPNPVPAKVMMSHILGADVVGRAVEPVTDEDQAYLERRAPEVLEELAEDMEGLWA